MEEADSPNGTGSPGVLNPGSSLGPEAEPAVPKAEPDAAAAGVGPPGQQPALDCCKENLDDGIACSQRKPAAAGDALHAPGSAVFQPLLSQPRCD